MPTTTASSQKGALVLGGAHGSLEIIRSLGRRGIPVWLVTDDNPLPTLSRYCGRNLRWPGPGENGALAFLAELAERYGLDHWVLFPGGDAEVQFVARNHAALQTIFRLTTPAWDVVRWACDKRWMNTRAAALGIALPQTYYPSGRRALAELHGRFPVILKPTIREGRNAFLDAKAWRADDHATLMARYDQAEALVGADRIMVQELIPGNGTAQFSYAAIWDEGRSVAALVARRRRQYPIDFGLTSTFVETAEAEEVKEAAALFLASLAYSGLVEIEFKRDARDGLYKMLDVNARAWTWIGLGALAGMDFPALQWRLACGEEVAPQSGHRTARWRHFSRDLVAAVQEMLAGSLSPIDYLQSFRGRSCSAVFARDDLLPGLLDLPLVAMRVARRRLGPRSRHIVADGPTAVSGRNGP